MLGAHPIEVALGSTSDRAQLKTILPAMANAGLAVFFCQPAGAIVRGEVMSGKEPAPEKALAPGTLKKMRADGENLGFGLASSNKVVLKRYLTQWQLNAEDSSQYPNIAVVPGMSRLLIVDVDTRSERDAFLEYWAGAEGWAATEAADITPTVLTPGQLNAQGEWAHKDGGHYYFTLPEGWEIPETGPGVLKQPGGWAIYMRDCYVLAPPSVRDEGPYIMAGKVHEAPEWLLEVARSKERIDRAAPPQDPAADEGASTATHVAQTSNVQPVDDMYNPQSIDEWAAGQDWDDLLQERGYKPFRLDKCGADCVIYTAPGVHASPKSCTAHGPVCAIYDQAMGHGPIHFWTDNAPEGFEGKGTYTLLQFLAISDHGGDVAQTLSEQGLSYGAQELKTLGVPEKPVPSLIIRPADYYRDTPAPEPLIDGFLFRQTQAMLVGAPSAGKSFVALDMAGCIATGRDWHHRKVHEGAVIYIAGEGFRGFVQRMHAWAAAYQRPDIWDKLYLVRDPYSIPADQRTGAAMDWWNQFVNEAGTLRPEMIVVDTLARVTVGLKENDASDMGRVVDLCNGLIETVETTVMLVHHTTRGTQHARGSTALLGSVDTELLVKPDAEVPNGLQLVSTKQKDAELAAPVTFQIHGGDRGSAYIAELGLKTVSDGAGAREAVKEVLATSGREAVKITDLHLSLTTRYGKTAIETAIAQLVESGEIQYPNGSRSRSLTTSVQLAYTEDTSPA